jgi:hypothetical protein
MHERHRSLRKRPPDACQDRPAFAARRKNRLRRRISFVTTDMLRLDDLHAMMSALSKLP